MLAVLNRRPETLSKTTIVVCFYAPVAIFCIVAVAFALLGIGQITVQQYLNVYLFAIIGGMITFFVLCFTNSGKNVITEVVCKGRELSVLSFIGLLVLLGASLPRIFGFV